jgi:hypothetical protein
MICMGALINDRRRHSEANVTQQRSWAFPLAHWEHATHEPANPRSNSTPSVVKL